LHVDALQVGEPWAAPGHLFAHFPQLAGSSVRSTQAPSQAMVPLEQSLLHRPASQTSFVSQVTSQLPQWLGSLLMSTHTPWHSP
jgi:hypothetical protein